MLQLTKFPSGNTLFIPYGNIDYVEQKPSHALVYLLSGKLLKVEENAVDIYFELRDATEE